MVSPEEPTLSKLENRCVSQERGGCLCTHPRGRRQYCRNQGSRGGRDTAKLRIPGRVWDAGKLKW